MKTDLIKVWTELSAIEKGILGRPRFTCAAIACRLREMGFECPSRAKDEQALVIFTMLQFFRTYGETWADEMEQYLKS